MTRSHALAWSAVFFAIAPGTIVGFGPWLVTHWRFVAPFYGVAALRYVGVAMILAALPVTIDSFMRFALQGGGTPAPIRPPEHLVVTGLYRYVRNPMYVAATTMIVGQALLFGSWRLIEYAAIVWLIAHLFVIVYEEPTLRKTYGAEYEHYSAAVPRWIPRFTARVYKPKDLSVDHP